MAFRFLGLVIRRRRGELYISILFIVASQEKGVAHSLNHTVLVILSTVVSLQIFQLR